MKEGTSRFAISRAIALVAWIFLGSTLLAQIQLPTVGPASESRPPGVASGQGMRQTELNQFDLAIPAELSPKLVSEANRLMQASIESSVLPDGRVHLRKDQEFVTVEIIGNENSLRVVGTRQLASVVAKLISSLAQQSTGGPARVVKLSAQGRKTLAAESVFQQPKQPMNAGPGDQGRSVFQAPVFRGFRRVQLASALQEGSPQLELGGEPPADGQEEPVRGLPLQQFDGVQVEMLPEIDAIILRGRDRQLDDLAEIIKQLDEASRLAQPEIEVLLLQHINSSALAALIQENQQSLLASRQGRVVAISLNNPNAILLIGWGDALSVAKELTAKLDQPLSPDSTFDVLQLKHASASQVQTQLQTFFQGRGNLGPIIQSTVDARTNAIIVHAAPRDLEQIKQLIARLDVPRGAATQQARVFEIRNSLATDIANTLREALTGSAVGANLPIELLDENGMPVATSGSLANSRITVNDRNNTIIVSTAPENLKLIEGLIQQLDTAGMVAKIKIFPVINADAGALVETLRSLIPSQAAATSGVAQLSSAPDESALIPLRFTVDGRGNNIIAVGSDGDLKIVEALIVRLDESDTMQRKSMVYQLKNSPAVDIALAVNEFLRSKRQVELVTPGSVNPFEQLEREVVVVPEPVQNKLIVSATPRYYEEISRLIEQLDQQPPQVMIQVLIAEIFLGNTHEFGLELGLQSSVLFDRSLLGDLLTRTTTTSSSTPAGIITETVEEVISATNQPGFNFNNLPLGNSGSASSLATSSQVGGQGLSSFSVGRQNEQLGFGGLVLSASSENVSFLLRALQECRRLEVLSRPQVLTLDNQQAFIQVGQRVPYVTSANVTQFGFQTNATLENVGLIIGVTPRISPEGNVVMEIDAEKSKLRPESEGVPISVAVDGSVIRSPILDTIRAQATVSAADGETIILGGLISKDTRVNRRKVPWLGDIPVVGNLFRYDFNQTERVELLIIMTPHVVRSQGDMQRLKQAEFARMNWCEADVFDIHGDVEMFGGPATHSFESEEWPVIFPDLEPRGKPLQPVREASPLRSPVTPEDDLFLPGVEATQFEQPVVTAGADSLLNSQSFNLPTANGPAPAVMTDSTYSALDLTPPPTPQNRTSNAESNQSPQSGGATSRFGIQRIGERR
jgi:general secretion pathway protein D